MADEQLALHLATPGIGLSQAILGQMKQGKPGELSADAVKRIGQGSDLDYATGGSRQVSALLGVLRNNRASDRAMAAAEGAPEHVVSFVSRMSHAANLAAQQSGVPARVILGQAALESGWASARSSIRMVAPATTCLASRPAPAGRAGGARAHDRIRRRRGEKVTQPFRAYSSYEESFADYARLIGNSPRYETVAQARNEVEAARRIQNSGYATDPQYAQKLIGIMNQLRGAARRIYAKPEGL